MNRDQKKSFVSSLGATFSKSPFILIAHYRGLTVPELGVLRTSLREVQGSARIAKNTLARLAITDDVMPNRDICLPYLKGPALFVTGSDPVALSKALVLFSKKNDKLAVVAAFFEGSVLLPADIKVIAELPSLDGLRAQLLATIQAPSTRLVSVLNQALAMPARLLLAYTKK